MCGVRGLPRVTQEGLGEPRRTPDSFMPLFLSSCSWSLGQVECSSFCAEIGHGLVPRCLGLIGFYLLSVWTHGFFFLSKERVRVVKEEGCREVPPPWWRGLKRASQGSASHGAAEAGAGHGRAGGLSMRLEIFPGVGKGCRRWGLTETQRLGPFPSLPEGGSGHRPGLQAH